MPKFARIEPEHDGEESYLFHCPGCECAHWVRVRGEKPCWQWNGNAEKPTVSPSIRVRTGETICHSFVTDGKIQFLGDCTHKLKGQTVEIPDFNDEA